MKQKESQKNRPLRIAMLGHKRIPSREGGIEIVVRELATRMVGMGHTVTCYNRGGHHVSGEEYDRTHLKEFQGVRMKYVPTIDRKGLAAMTSSFFASFRAAFGRYDVVHYHAEGPCFWLWIPKLFGKRCIATVHGLDHRRAKWGKVAKWVIMRGEKCAVRFADEIIVLTHAEQEYFQETYGRATHLIPNGAHHSTVREADEIVTKWGLIDQSYNLYLGRIVPEKGLQYLVEAYKQVKTEKPLIIAGGSSDTQAFMDTLKEMAKDDPRIRFVGFVEGSLRRELLSCAYTYILPSDLEGMPLSLLEAMSYGNCCLTSDIPACTEVVEDHAVNFPHGDVDALARAIQDLCDNPETVASYQEGAQPFIWAKYSWDKVTEETLALYRRER